jgi:hypothetical protein
MSCLLPIYWSLGSHALSALPFSMRIKVGNTFLRNVMLGDRPVPPKRIEARADEMELAGEERERFLDDAWLTHCPPYVHGSRIAHRTCMNWRLDYVMVSSCYRLERSPSSGKPERHKHNASMTHASVGN